MPRPPSSFPLLLLLLLIYLLLITSIVPARTRPLNHEPRLRHEPPRPLTPSKHRRAAAAPLPNAPLPHRAPAMQTHQPQIAHAPPHGGGIVGIDRAPGRGHRAASAWRHGRIPVYIYIPVGIRVRVGIGVGVGIGIGVPIGVCVRIRIGAGGVGVVARIQIPLQPRLPTRTPSQHLLQRPILPHPRLPRRRYSQQPLLRPPRTRTPSRTTLRPGCAHPRTLVPIPIPEPLIVPRPVPRQIRRGRFEPVFRPPRPSPCCCLPLPTPSSDSLPVA